MTTQDSISPTQSLVVHKATLITKETLEDYINFVNWQLGMKNTLYGDETKYRTVAFEYIKYIWPNTNNINSNNLIQQS